MLKPVQENPLVVIAEAGVNHNGDLNCALQLVDIAASARADYVKFQTFSVDRLVTTKAPKAAYQKRASGVSEAQTQFDMLRQLELSPTDHEKIVRRCEDVGIGFLSTGFDERSVDYLVELGVDLIKVPSGELTNRAYLEHVADIDLPLVVSTGMATLPEIGDALNVLWQTPNRRNQTVVLHCTTDYPTKMQDVNLRAMQTIAETYDVAIGYSDHTLGIEVPIAACAMGARIIEKHFTCDRGLPGPDHAASLEPDELRAMVAAIRNIEIALGSAQKVPTNRELENALVARKVLVAAVDIAEGEAFSRSNIRAKRAGLGISAMLLPSILGKVAKRGFQADEVIVL